MIPYRKRPDALPQQIFISDTQQQQGIPPADIRLAEQVSEHLFKHYPNHGWMVWASHEQGVVTISLPGLPDNTPERRAALNYKGVVKIATLNSDPDMRSVTRAAGRLLEAWGLKRGALDRAAFNEAKPDEAAFPLIGRARKRGAQKMRVQYAKPTLVGADGVTPLTSS